MTTDPAIYNDFVIYQGSTFDEQIILQDANEQVIDLTNKSARMKIRSKTGTEVAALSTDDGKITITPLAGQVDWILTDSETAAIDAGIYLYDLEIYDNARVDKYVRGQIAVIAEQTS